MFPHLWVFALSCDLANVIFSTWYRTLRLFFPLVCANVQTSSEEGLWPKRLVLPRNDTSKRRLLKV